jgi:energy-coupling factor transporter ATP-binding protein EcfA2
MISSIQIRDYRGFKEFGMDELGTVNLLVGKNNSGKTSVLEAINLLVSRGEPSALWQVLWRRGEQAFEQAAPSQEMDISHLFRGHEIHQGSKFEFTAKNESPERSVSFLIAELNAEQAQANAPRAGNQAPPIPSRFGLAIKSAPNISRIPLLALTPQGGLTVEAMQARPRPRRGTPDEPITQFITTESLDSNSLVHLWNTIVLTPFEPLVLRALQFIEPQIERIAAQAATQPYYGVQYRGGFITKMAGYSQPIPIGSLGDGIWRMLAMAIAITKCKGGVLLIDEIDTGLHHTVMADMWKLIFGTAKDLDVQIFATTHSFDCVHSLAKVCVGNVDPKHKITLQRVETDKHKSIPYSEEEIVIAADKHIEVR